MRALAPVLMLVPMLASGCTLIDQTTFERAGKAPDAAQLSKTDLPPLPLLTIRFDNPDFDIRPSVAEAVEAVQSRKADADYEVLAPIPTNGTAAVQDIFAKLGQEDTEKVVEALGYAGVSLEHVHVGYRGDPGAPAREVTVYVR